MGQPLEVSAEHVKEVAKMNLNNNNNNNDNNNNNNNRRFGPPIPELFLLHQNSFSLC